MPRKNPIHRNNKFFGAEDFALELDFGKEYVEQDVNQTIILYQVDLNRTQVSDIYNEAKKGNIAVKTPIELPVIYTIEDTEVKTYDTQQMKGYFVNVGRLTFSVYISTLEEYECDINRGDYIGVQVSSDHIEYFSVVDDGRVGSYSNRNSMFGTQPIIRNIIAIPIDKNEFYG